MSEREEVSSMGIGSAPLTRRQVLKGAVVLGAGAAMAPVIAACGGGSTEDAGASEKVTMVFCGNGGALQSAESRAWIEPFMKAHPNVNIIQDTSADYAKVKAMVEAGDVTWDVLDCGNDFALGPTAALCTDLDKTAIPWDELQPDLLMTSGQRAATFLYGVIVAYRPDLLNGNVPTTFSDFFDLKRFPGKRGVQNNPTGGMLEMALMADGVLYEELYPLDVDRALKKWDTIKSSVVWWETGAQSAQLLADGEVTMEMAWNGRIATIQEGGSPAQIMWTQWFVTGEYFVIPKGSKHVKEATELIAWATSAEHNGELSKYITYGPANSGAANALPLDTTKNLPTAHIANAVGFNDEWINNNQAEVVAKVQKWQTQ